MTERQTLVSRPEWKFESTGMLICGRPRWRERGGRQRGREEGRKGDRDGVRGREGRRGRRACVEDVVLVVLYLQDHKRRWPAQRNALS